MKTKYSDLIAKIFFTAVVVVLVGLLIAWMAGVFKDKKQDLNSGTEKIDTAINSMADFDLLVYDGKTIGGEALANLIKDYKTKDVQLSIWVNTLDKADTYYNYGYTSSNLGSVVTITPPASKTASGYIATKGSFKGSVIKNENNEIVCLKFTQQK